ncbi:helix-turn-helix domain-containing protein [Massilia endophytica]|uniref:helix-turn-helix domain-containing protein n=1 Tax=Massilia endophytica TaxID=2899220 RepID=UPI001E564849|nr:helix-turn-helix domain-containing protein [Massilia endophytica]UGQ49053.1 helix-turn-helix domain-containing protein [Massilia endophytica]
MEKNDSAKGIVDPAGAAQRFAVRRHAPSAALAPFVEFFWIVEWDMRGREPQTQRVLPYPNAHIAFEPGLTGLYGVVQGPFDKHLEGEGRVLGARFRPGGLRPWLSGPVSSLSGRTVTLDEAFGIDGACAEKAVLAQPDDPGMIAVAEEFLAPLARRSAPDPRVAHAEAAVKAAEAEHGPVSVAELAQVAGVSERGLQRLFHDYVGVPPKWVVQRFRLQEAMWRLARPGTPDLTELALELGFFDQSHLTRHFTALVGKPPLEYWKSQRAK